MIWSSQFGEHLAAQTRRVSKLDPPTAAQFGQAPPARQASLVAQGPVEQGFRPAAALPPGASAATSIPLPPSLWAMKALDFLPDPELIFRAIDPSIQPLFGGRRIFS